MRSRTIASLIFKIKFNPISGETYYFDMTTYVLTKLLLKNLDKKSRVLDMGTGSCCVIGLSLWKHLKCSVISTDVNQTILSLANENANLNHAEIKFIHSNLFENIHDDFNVVTFNPPYVPTENGIKDDLSKKFQSQWDGGLDGTKIIEEFLNQLEKLNKSVIAYVGINHKYVSKNQLVFLINQHNNLKVKKIYNHSILPVQICVIKN